MASRSRIGSQRANATEASYHEGLRAQESGLSAGRGIRARAWVRGLRLLCYDLTDPPIQIMASIQATRLKKGMLIKVEQDLFRVLELQHVTPGNLRGFVRVKLRNIRNGSLSDQKLRSEDSLDRATLDEREMQYLSLIHI